MGGADCRLRGGGWSWGRVHHLQTHGPGPVPGAEGVGDGDSCSLSVMRGGLGVAVCIKNINIYLVYVSLIISKHAIGARIKGACARKASIILARITGASARGASAIGAKIKGARGAKNNRS